MVHGRSPRGWVSRPGSRRSALRANRMRTRPITLTTWWIAPGTPVTRAVAAGVLVPWTGSKRIDRCSPRPQPAAPSAIHRRLHEHRLAGAGARHRRIVAAQRLGAGVDEVAAAAGIGVKRCAAAHCAPRPRCAPSEGRWRAGRRCPRSLARSGPAGRGRRSMRQWRRPPARRCFDQRHAALAGGGWRIRCSPRLWLHRTVQALWNSRAAARSPSRGVRRPVCGGTPMG